MTHQMTHQLLLTKHNRVKTVKTSLSNRSIVQSVNLDIVWSFAITVTNFTGFQTNKAIRRDITVKIEFLLKFGENDGTPYIRDRHKISA